MIELEQTRLGKIAADEGVLVAVAEHAARDAVGIHAVKQPDVALDGDRSVSVSVAVVVERGAVMPEAGRAVQERIAEALTTAIEPRRVRVDVTIDGVAG